MEWRVTAGCVAAGAARGAVELQQGMAHTEVDQLASRHPVAHAASHKALWTALRQIFST